MPAYNALRSARAFARRASLLRAAPLARPTHGALARSPRRRLEFLARQALRLRRRLLPVLNKPVRPPC